MPRKRTTGLNTVRRYHPDGTLKRLDHYHRRSGILLGHDHAQAVELAARMDAEEDARGAGPPPGSFEAIARAWLASPAFAKKAPRTKALERVYLDNELRARFGALPVSAITRPVVIRLRDKLSPRAPVKARHVLGVLRQVLQYAVDAGTITQNSALRPGLPIPKARRQVWSQQAIDAFLEVAPPRVRRGFMLMLYTAQRVSDVLAMDWSQLTRQHGRVIMTMTQGKTGELISFPLAQPLTAELKATWQPRGPIVPNARGGRWDRRAFTRAFVATVCRANRRLAREGFKAGMNKAEVRSTLITGLQARDLRRTAMVAMARKGATAAQIASVSGHRIDECQKILDVYLPRRLDLALKAIEALERADSDVQPLDNRMRRGLKDNP